MQKYANIYILKSPENSDSFGPTMTMTTMRARQWNWSDASKLPSWMENEIMGGIIRVYIMTWKSIVRFAFLSFWLFQWCRCVRQCNRVETPRPRGIRHKFIHWKRFDRFFTWFLKKKTKKKYWTPPHGLHENEVAAYRHISKRDF